MSGCGLAIHGAWLCVWGNRGEGLYAGSGGPLLHVRADVSQFLRNARVFLYVFTGRYRFPKEQS